MSTEELCLFRSGNSFIDRFPDSLSRLGDFTLNDFDSYFLSLRQSEKYGRPHFVRQASNECPDQPKSNPMINIPQLFLSSQFSLSDSSTFNLVFPGIIPNPSASFSPTHVEIDTKRSTSTSSDKSDGSHRRPSNSSSAAAAGHKSTANGTVRFVRTSLFLSLSYEEISVGDEEVN